MLLVMQQADLSTLKLLEIAMDLLGKVRELISFCAQKQQADALKISQLQDELAAALADDASDDERVAAAEAAAVEAAQALETVNAAKQELETKLAEDDVEEAAIVQAIDEFMGATASASETPL